MISLMHLSHKIQDSDLVCCFSLQPKKDLSHAFSLVKENVMKYFRQDTFKKNLQEHLQFDVAGRYLSEVQINNAFILTNNLW